jgi:hypothetical protein
VPLRRDDLCVTHKFPLIFPTGLARRTLGYYFLEICPSDGCGAVHSFRTTVQNAWHGQKRRCMLGVCQIKTLGRFDLHISKISYAEPSNRESSASATKTHMRIGLESGVIIGRNNNGSSQLCILQVAD